MAVACFNCGKTVSRGNLVSHAKNRTKTVRKPNLHRAHMMIDGRNIKVLLCTKCMRRHRAAHPRVAKVKPVALVAPVKATAVTV